MTTWDNEYMPFEDEQENDDDEILNYYFIVKDQSEEVTNLDLDTFMSYDKL